VTVAITSVKNAPDAESSDAFVLHAGVKVTVIERVETWIKIRLPTEKWAGCATASSSHLGQFSAIAGLEVPAKNLFRRFSCFITLRYRPLR